MKVFISWSGDRSKEMAEALGEWLPDVIQAVVPWISTQDIRQGSRPLPDISDQLEGTNFGIACITAENRESAWVNFEAGALSKSLKGSGVVPLLLGIDKSQVTGPLSQFQMTVSTDRSEMYKLVRDINERLGEAAIASERLERAFGRNWGQLQAALDSIGVGSGKGEEPPRRSPEDLLSEILLLMRKQDIRFRSLESSIDQLQITARPPRIVRRGLDEMRREINDLERIESFDVVREKGFAAFGSIEIQEIDMKDDIVRVILDPSAQFDSEMLKSAADQLCNSIGRSVYVVKDGKAILIQRLS